MSDLQTALLVIGAGVVAAVYGFNLWQERQFKRRTELAFEREHTDILMPDAPATHAGEPALRVEPRLDITPPATPVAQSAPRPVLQPVDIDPVIDFVVEVTLPAAASSAALL